MGAGRGVTADGCRGFPLGMKDALKLDCSGGCTSLNILKPMHFKWVNCILCKLYLSKAVFKKDSLEFKS